MARQKTVSNPDDVRRIQIRSSRQQEDILKAAAKAVGAELGPWCLAHLMAAASVPVTQEAGKAPLIVTGGASERLRRLASANGMPPSVYLEQLLITAGA